MQIQGRAEVGVAPASTIHGALTNRRRLVWGKFPSRTSSIGHCNLTLALQPGKVHPAVLEYEGIVRSRRVFPVSLESVRRDGVAEPHLWRNSSARQRQIQGPTTIRGRVGGQVAYLGRPPNEICTRTTPGAEHSKAGRAPRSNVSRLTAADAEDKQPPCRHSSSYEYKLTTVRTPVVRTLFKRSTVSKPSPK